MLDDTDEENCFDSSDAESDRDLSDVVERWTFFRFSWTTEWEKISNRAMMKAIGQLFRLKLIKPKIGTLSHRKLQFLPWIITVQIIISLNYLWYTRRQLSSNRLLQIWQPTRKNVKQVRCKVVKKLKSYSKSSQRTQVSCDWCHLSFASRGINKHRFSCKSKPENSDYAKKLVNQLLRLWFFL